MGFRENLKDELKYQDMKVKELADKAAVPKRTIDHYLTENSYMPSAETAVRIAQALHVSVEYLVTGTDPSFSPAVKNAVVPLIKKLNSLSDGDLHFFAEVLDRLAP
ncbi:MAG: helix-turn-helix domain-containing protein [Treponemataceae bacterium]|nr:helix-turn-helix domain-containing protein [Treponemataceae bacterium]